MQPHLRYTDEPELKIQPDTLLAHLEKHCNGFEAILEELHCTPEDLAQTLADPKTTELLRVKAQVAATQVKLIAIQYAPHAIVKLVQLASTAEKPEVARRSAAAVLQITGIPTRTAQQPAPEPPSTKPVEPTFEMDDKEANDLLDVVADMLALKRQQNIDLKTIPADEYPRFVTLLQNFLASCTDYNPQNPFNERMPSPTPDTPAPQT